MATTQADGVFTAVLAPRARAVPRVVGAPGEATPSRSTATFARGAEGWALARDAAGGLLVLGSWAALWSWFVAATW